MRLREYPPLVVFSGTILFNVCLKFNTVHT